MQLKSALAICACLLVADTAACNLSTGTTPFAVVGPVVEEGEALRAPALEMVSLTRGINGRASCDASGLLTLRVEWPRGTDYKLREVGFEFRVIAGNDPLAIFPDAPVAGRVDGRRSEFVFLWEDGPPADQRPIDLVVEVRAVTPDNRRGPPARLHIAAAPGS